MIHQSYLQLWNLAIHARSLVLNRFTRTKCAEKIIASSALEGTFDDPSTHLADEKGVNLANNHLA